MSCAYCIGFNESEARFKESRLCRTTGKSINEKTKECPRFSLYHYFWCRNSACWLDIPVCGSRRSKNDPGCKGCLQWIELREMRKFRSTKPTIIKFVKKG